MTERKKKKKKRLDSPDIQISLLVTAAQKKPQN